MKCYFGMDIKEFECFLFNCWYRIIECVIVKVINYIESFLVVFFEEDFRFLSIGWGYKKCVVFSKFDWVF